MADAVERALTEDRVLLCEAGTGTGKTLAYLVPALLSGRKVIVSTATRALQEQLEAKDLPLIRRCLGIDVPTAVMKGLSNYLCLRRYEAFRTSAQSLEPEVARKLLAIEPFARTSPTGDVAELEGVDESDPVWGEVCSSTETRIGTSCPRYDECFVTRMREQARRAQLVVVNHHLFFADLALRGPHAGGALPPYDAVIFDEAHQLEDAATEFFGTRVSSSRVVSLVREAQRALESAGLLATRGPRRRTRRPVERALDQSTPMLATLGDCSTRFFGEVLRHLPASSDSRAELERDRFCGELLAAYHRLDTSLEVLAAYAEQHAISEELELVSKRTHLLRDNLAAIVDGSRNQVTWAEGRSHSVSIGASPIALASFLKAKLFDQVPAVVLTSATLKAGRGFSFVRSRLGIDEKERTVHELEVPSPFDFASRALLYVPRDLPDPSAPAWIEAAAQRARQLIDASGGGAFVLATSKRVMTALYAALASPAPESLTNPPPHAERPDPRGRLVLMQGQAPKGMLLERFREAENAVLVATMSFWEGVDVPGRALRLVIIDKVPFAVPTDPLVVARSAALQEEGKNPFYDYQVPAAAIALKQGFGRLIRTDQDAGVVAILDGRIHSKPYGKLLVASLPAARRTTDLEEALRFARSLS